MSIAISSAGTTLTQASSSSSLAAVESRLANLETRLGEKEQELTETKQDTEKAKIQSEIDTLERQIAAANAARAKASENASQPVPVQADVQNSLEAIAGENTRNGKKGIYI